jgi:tRNA threonylcarbamoyladenosine biosynthesis protein TsaB
MRILGLDAAGAWLSACLIEDGVVLAEQECLAVFGQPAILPGLVAAVLERRQGGVDHIAAGIGPGGFTGIRTALALAHGLANGRGVGVSGVSILAALPFLLDNPQGRPVWAAIDNRRGGIFLLRPDALPASLAEAALPAPQAPILLGGSGAAVAAARLLARGAPVALGSLRGSVARGVALAAAAGLRTGEALPPALPLYIDQPAVT